MKSGGHTHVHFITVKVGITDKFKWNAVDAIVGQIASKLETGARRVRKRTRQRDQLHPMAHHTHPMQTELSIK